MSRLTLDKLTLAQGGRTVLEDVSGTFEDGAITEALGDAAHLEDALLPLAVGVRVVGGAHRRASFRTETSWRSSAS